MMTDTAEKTYRLAAEGNEIGEFTIAEILREGPAMERNHYYFNDAASEWQPVSRLTNAARLRQQQEGTHARATGAGTGTGTAAPAAVVLPTLPTTSGYTAFFYLLALLSGFGGVVFAVLASRYDYEVFMVVGIFITGFFQAVIFAACAKAMELLGFIHENTRLKR